MLCVIDALNNFVTENLFFVMTEIQHLGYELLTAIKSGNGKGVCQNAAHFFQVIENTRSY